MKNSINKMKLLMFSVSFAAIIFSLVSQTSAQMNIRERVTGRGSLPVTTPDGDPAKRQFAIEAQRQANGIVKGNAILRNPAFTNENGQVYRLQIDISCMKAIGNIVFFGGTTKRTNDQSLVDAVFFSVQDNGEPGAGLDTISQVYFYDDDPATTGDPQICQNYNPGDFPMEAIESGNIQVRSLTNY